MNILWTNRAWLWSILFGVIHAQAFSSFNVWPLQLIALSGLIFLCQRNPYPRQMMVLGGAFGLGWFVAGIWWLFISLYYFGEMPAILAGGAVFILSGVLALFPMFACLCVFFCFPNKKTYYSTVENKKSLIVSLNGSFVWAVAWMLSELLRGTVFTGFPWLASGYAHTDGPLSGFAPLVGVYGISGLTAWLAALLVQALQINQFVIQRLIYITLIVGVLGLGFVLKQIEWTVLQGHILNVRLLQGNIGQDIKFDPQHLRDSLERYTKWLIADDTDLIITPETAYPLVLEDIPVRILQALRHHANKNHVALLVGAAGQEKGRDGIQYTNSVFGWEPNQPADFIQPSPLKPPPEPLPPKVEGPNLRYNKHHLVPFGEFVPFGFRWFVDWMVMPMGDFARGAVVQSSLSVKGQRLAPHICYEDVFGDQLAAVVRDPRTAPGILVNVTNIAWFGDGLAMDQHLHIARMRAIETGRPMLRATNTGVTAHIDHRGVVLAVLPRATVGTLDVKVQAMQGLTPYVRWGDFPLWMFSFVSLLVLKMVSSRSA
jgi:apolipoprotein N-acyltransferase